CDGGGEVPDSGVDGRVFGDAQQSLAFDVVVKDVGFVSIVDIVDAQGNLLSEQVIVHGRNPSTGPTPTRSATRSRRRSASSEDLRPAAGPCLRPSTSRRTHARCRADRTDSLTAHPCGERPILPARGLPVA